MSLFQFWFLQGICLEVILLVHMVVFEKWKVKVAQSCLTLCDLMDCTYTVYGIFQVRTLKLNCHSLLWEIPDTGIEPRSPALWVDSLSSEPPGRPLFQLKEKWSEVKVFQSCLTLCDLMDYTVHGILQARILECSLSLLQGILPTHGSNPGLLHCRRILYQLSHKGSPSLKSTN